MKIIVKEAADVPPFPEEYTQKKRVSHTSFSPYLVLFWSSGVGSARCSDGSCRGRKWGQSSGRVIREPFPSFL